VNNALARAGGLLAVAVLPGLAGISGADYVESAAFAVGFRIAVLIPAGLMVCAAAMAVVGIRRPPVHPDQWIAVEECMCCAITDLPAHPTAENR
jgi:hypothetical protein